MKFSRFLAKAAAVSAVSMAFASASTAQAASFIYNVNYDGATATLAPGSDDLGLVNLMAGDTLTYSLNATGGNGWTVLADIAPNFTFALPLNESGTRIIDYTLDLNLFGSNVYSLTENNVSNSFVHLGPNTTPLSSGLQFTQSVVSLTLLSSDADTTVTSLLPIFGPLEDNANISFGAVAAVPEPATWAFMIFGFGAVGGALRSSRQRKATVNVSYA